MPSLHLPIMLKRRFQFEDPLKIQASNYVQLCQALRDHFPELYGVLFNKDGVQHGYFQFVLGDTLYNSKSKGDIEDDAEIHLLMPMSGG